MVLSVDGRAAELAVVCGSVSADEAGAAGVISEASVGAVIGKAVVEAGVPVGAVIPEVTAVPVAAVEAYAEEAEAVVNAAVVADGRAPVSGVPVVAVGVIAPVAGGPQGSYVGGGYP